MRLWLIPVVLVVGLAACSRRDAPPPRENTAAKQAGRSAYELAEKTKRAAKAAGRELREASREAREGWKEARDEDRAKKGK